MSSKGATVVVFQGNKVFWRSKNTINVTIVDHRDTDRTEIICYEPTLETEAPRIYMDSVILATKLDQEYIGSKLLLAKQEKVPNSIKFVNDIVDRATAHYILDRLFQTEYNAETKAFKVKIQFSFNDRDLEPDDDSIDRLVCEKLERTTPYHVDHKKVEEPVETVEVPPAAQTPSSAVPEGVQAPADSSPALSSSTMSPSLPSRLRRSYLGSFFASFSISSDEHAHDGVHPEEAQPALLAQRLGRKKFERQHSLGNTLSSWMHRSHADVQVLPLSIQEDPTGQGEEGSGKPVQSAEPEPVVIKHRRTGNVAYQ